MNIFHKKLRNAHFSLRALRGLLLEESSFQIQLTVALFVVFLGFYFNLSALEWTLVILIIGIVLAIEALNTAIEELCDHVTPEEHPKIGIVKDTSAAASLLFGIASIIAGVLIFLPHIISAL